LEQLVGRAKTFWASLTNDELLRSEGDLDRIEGVRKEMVGKAREEFQWLLYERVNRRP